MNINLWVNDKQFSEEIPDDLLLLDFLRRHQFTSAKCGCETSNCGICTVMMEDKPVLACSTLALRAAEKHVYTMEGVQEEAKMLGVCLAGQGADQCGFCNPGLLMAIIAMKKELNNPTDEEIKAYLSGNLCRCTGYQAQLRGIRDYLSGGAERRVEA